jgi:ABC-type branched-subunit amino acid transport system ATPase component
VTDGLEIHGLAKRFGGIEVFTDVNAVIPHGQITAVIGPNGAGKSTLINIVCGVLRAEEGRVTKNGRDLGEIRPHQAVKHGLARTFQDVRVFPTLTVAENVLVGMPDQPGDRFLPLFGRKWQQTEQELRKRCLNELGKLGLEGEALKPAEEIPFGSQKLLSLCRAAATDADTLLLDEPTTGLEVSRAPLVSQYLRELRDAGRAILLVEHNVEVVADLADQVIVLQGTVIAAGSADQVLRDERVIREYLGRLYDA